VIFIQYRDLSAGLHGKAECAGRSTTVYLVPGLTRAQQNAALRRLRQESRMGCGPRLSAVQLALAVVADRIRTGLGQMLAVIRWHPALTVLPTLLVATLAWLFVASMPAHPGALPSSQGPAAVSPGDISPEVVATIIGTSVPGYLGSPLRK
jgi:hypothetical protein